MRVTFINAQFIGKSHYENAEKPSSNRTYMHFIYQSPNVEGYACFTFAIFDVDKYRKAEDFIMKKNYRIGYHRENGFVVVDDIQDA